MGQAIEGVLVEARTAESVPGAFVALLDGAGRQVDGSLTDEAGRFLVRGPRSGIYRLEIQRIGFESVTSRPIALERGRTVAHRMVAPVAPVALPEITATTERRCEIRPAEGRIATRIWGEVQKALVVTEWTRRQGLLRYTLSAWKRRLAPRTMEVVSETTRRLEGVTASSPWIAGDPAVLVEEGFVQPDGDDLVYHGPDASTVLSDAFLDTHCFRPVPPPKNEPGWIGLAFEPDHRRGVPDVEGVLWVDRATSELRRLDFEYVDLPRVVRVGAAQGRVEFERMATGAWIVRRWWIRMPVAGSKRPFLYLSVIEEDGGEVLAVHSVAPDGVRTRLPTRTVWAEPIPIEGDPRLSTPWSESVEIFSDSLSSSAAIRTHPEDSSLVSQRNLISSGTANPGIVVVVLDKSTGLPVRRARVSLPDIGTHGVTDGEGRIIVDMTPVGFHRILVEHPDYFPAEDSIQTPATGWRIIQALLTRK